MASGGGGTKASQDGIKQAGKGEVEAPQGRTSAVLGYKEQECHPTGKPEPITEGFTDQATGFKLEVPLCTVNMSDMVKPSKEDRIGVRLP